MSATDAALEKEVSSLRNEVEGLRLIDFVYHSTLGLREREEEELRCRVVGFRM